MKLNSNAKFEEKLTLGSKNDMRNFNSSSGKFAKNVHFDVLLLSILTRAEESLKICTLMGYVCQKYVIFELKKYG